jgi:hypothetical protein
MDEDLKWEAVQIAAPGGLISIASASTRRSLPYDDLRDTASVPDGFSAGSILLSGRTHAEESRNPPPILIVQPNPASRGRLPVALLEGHSYIFRVALDTPAADDPVKTSLTQATSALVEWVPPWKTDVSSKEWHGHFSVQNYLGSAWIDAGVVRLAFDIVPTKLGYEDDYRQMTEEVGSIIRNALLEITGPTTHHFAKSEDSETGTLLEQYQYLKSGIGLDRLKRWLKLISRNPHRRLAAERRWSPSSSANPSLFLRNPLRHGRDWHRVGKRTIPGWVEEVRKFDSFDTPPNRFVLFALKRMLSVAINVRRQLAKKRGNKEAPGAGELEAAKIASTISMLLKSGVFGDPNGPASSGIKPMHF